MIICLKCRWNSWQSERIQIFAVQWLVGLSLEKYVKDVHLIVKRKFYTGLHSGQSLAWNYFCGDIADPCGIIGNFCGVIADPDALSRSLRWSAMPIIAQLTNHRKTLLNIVKHHETLIKIVIHRETYVKHCELLVKQHETLLKHCETSWYTLYSMWWYRCSMQSHRHSVRQHRRSAWWYRLRVIGDLYLLIKEIWIFFPGLC